MTPPAQPTRALAFEATVLRPRVGGLIEAILVPQRATGRASGGTLTAFVARNSTARKVTLTASGRADNRGAATQGAAEGDLLIVDGLTNLTEGAKTAAGRCCDGRDRAGKRRRGASLQWRECRGLRGQSRGGANGWTQSPPCARP